MLENALRSGRVELTLAVPLGFDGRVLQHVGDQPKHVEFGHDIFLEPGSTWVRMRLSWATFCLTSAILFAS